jgi:aspartate/methionine/tyrosine aminotransferase
MADRTVTIGGAGKMFAITGWRVGWVVARPPLSGAVRAVHELLTVGAPHPLQLAVAEAMAAGPSSYHAEVRDELRARRDVLVDGLARIGFEVDPPEGGFFVMAGIERFAFASDVVMARHLIERCAVSSVPGSGVYSGEPPWPLHLRFTFARGRETIRRGLESLGRLLGRGWT